MLLSLSAITFAGCATAVATTAKKPYQETLPVVHKWEPMAPLSHLIEVAQSEVPESWYLCPDRPIGLAEYRIVRAVFSTVLVVVERGHNRGLVLSVRQVAEVILREQQGIRIALRNEGMVLPHTWHYREAKEKEWATKSEFVQNAGRIKDYSIILETPNDIGKTVPYLITIHSSGIRVLCPKDPSI